MRSKRLFQTLTRPVLFAAAYYCAARLGLMLIVHPESVSVFWPAAGLLLGILIVSRKRDWRWILPLAVISHFIAEMSIVVNPWLAAGFSLVEPLGAALAVLLLQRI
ncbi:MAG TPA: hypothetical protein VE398_03325, partial [Acidobacteriota bacterium]|nr:hypothetical protein [Acidobacteriota bacterium]